MNELQNCYCEDDLCHMKACVSKSELAERRDGAEFLCIKAASADFAQ